MADAKDELHFAVFMEADSNYHIAGWRLPEAYEDTGLSLARWIELAQMSDAIPIGAAAGLRYPEAQMKSVYL